MLELLQKACRTEWLVRLLNPLFGQYNPFLPEFYDNPYAQYARLRQTAPVYRSQPLQGWVLSRHRDVEHVLTDSRFSVLRQESNIIRRYVFKSLPRELSQAVMRMLLMLDPPDHTRMRKLVSKAFTARRVELLRPRIERIVADLLDQLSGAGEIEIMRSFAIPLPTIVIAETLGVPPEDRDHFKRWSDALTALFDPFQAEGGMAPVARAFFEWREYLLEVFAARRRVPGDDLISALVQAEDDGQKLDETDVLALVILLLVAGNETTTNLIGNAVRELMGNPTQCRRLRDNPKLAAAAVEELLRFDSPVQVTDRIALADCTLGGKRIRKGQLLLLLLGAANRDPEVFSEPDRLDFGRENNPHLAFSQGVHFCLGSQLARLEAQIAIPALLARYPRLCRTPAPVKWKRSLVLRGPTELWLSTDSERSTARDARGPARVEHGATALSS